MQQEEEKNLEKPEVVIEPEEKFDENAPETQEEESKTD